MKAKEWLANQYAKSVEVTPFVEMIREDSYLIGFERAIELASSLMVQLAPDKGKGLAILINGIGSVKVDPETGKRLDDLG